MLLSLVPFRKRFATGTRHLFEKGVLKWFPRPEILLRSVYNTMDVTPERVVANFFQGTFLLGRVDTDGLEWRSYPARAVITPESARIQKSLRNYMNRSDLELRVSTDIREVILRTRRESENWVNREVVELYGRLADMGFTESFELHDESRMVAGMWGLRIGRTWSIMSMFHDASRAGSILFGQVAESLSQREIDLLDCGAMNSNFRRFGAVEMPLEEFVGQVARGIGRHSAVQTIPGVNGKSKAVKHEAAG